MTIAEADGMRLAYIEETTEGSTPATPAFQIVRYTSESLVGAKSTIQSSEMRPDKNVSDVIHTGDDVAGNISGELSYSTYDDFLEALFRGAWSTDVLINGITRKSFTIEKTTEEGATDSFFRYRGCFVNSMTMSMAQKAIIGVDFGFIGMGVDDGAAAIISGATYTAANTNEVMPSGTFIGSVTIGGLSTQPTIHTLDLEVNSNVRGQGQVASNDLAGVALGKFTVTGNLGLYLSGIEAYNAIRDHDTDITITIELGSVTGEKYTVLLPNVRLTSGDPIAGGEDQDISFDVGFQAIYDATTVGSMKITRAVA